MKGSQQQKTAYLTQYVCYISPVWSMGRFIARFIGSTVDGFLSLSYIGYVPPHRVGFLCRFSLKTGNYTLCSFWSGIGYGFREECMNVFIVSIFQMSKKEREICEFEMDLKNIFFCTLI